MKVSSLALIAAPLVLALTACAGGNGDSASTASPSPEVDQAQLLEDWASRVCTSADALATTVTGIADGLDVDLGAGLDQLPAIQEQVAGNLAGVEAGIDEVEIALAAAPSGSPEAQEFAVEMRVLIDSARASGQEAVELLGEASSASNVLTGGLAAAAAVAAAQSAYGDASAALDLLDRTRNEGTGDLGAAFASADGC